MFKKQESSPVKSPWLRVDWVRWICSSLFIIGFLQADTARAAKEELVIGITTFPPEFHPNIGATLAKYYVLDMVTRPFTAYDPNWELSCILCTQLPTLENGFAELSDNSGRNSKINLTYRIRDDAFWGDGVSITTDDVLFTYKVGRHPESRVTNADKYQRIDSIDVLDEKTFVLHVDRATYDYNSIGYFRLLPAHLERPIFSEDPANYHKRSLYGTDATNNGLYFGPYKITDISIGAHIVLEPNPTWWGEPPYFERIVIKAIENTAAVEANLLSGEIDMIAGEVGLSIDQALAFQKRHGDRYRIVYKPGLVYEQLEFNHDNPILADHRVRKALIQGINREAISQELFEGRQLVAHASVNPLDWVHFEDVQKYEEDLASAAALLDEAGWREIKDGIRYNANGDPLSLELMTTSGNRTRELVLEVIQSQWRRLGVTATIRNETPRVFFGETVPKRKFRAVALFASLSPPESVPRPRLHSTQIPTQPNGWRGQNYGGYRNREIDNLLDDLERQLDRDLRLQLWRRFQEVYARELPAIPLYFRTDSHIWPNWLTGIVPTGHQDTSAMAVEMWRPEDAN